MNKYTTMCCLFHFQSTPLHMKNLETRKKSYFSKYSAFFTEQLFLRYSLCNNGNKMRDYQTIPDFTNEDVNLTKVPFLLSYSFRKLSTDPEKNVFAFKRINEAVHCSESR